MNRLSRRKFIAAGAASFAIWGFDPFTRSWLSEAEAQTCDGAIPTPPNLDGVLTTDPAVLAEAADDFGHIVSLMPRAVLLPGSEKDISAIIKWANRNGVQVAARGRGHAVFGEGQVDCGIVIDMNSLDRIHSIESNHAVVDAGVKWSTLVSATLAQGLTPLILTDYLELSVGGVLSVGGIGGNMNQVGMVTDNVDAIDVVTGKGQRTHNVSTHHKSDLFESALAGLGQVGVITRAKIRLGPAPVLARIYELTYTNLSDYVSDQRTLALDGRFGYLEGQIVADGSGSWLYKIEAGAYYTPPALPDDIVLLAGLSPDVGTQTTDFPYEVWLNRVGAAEAALRQFGLWDLPHAWSDLFIPDDAVSGYVKNHVVPFLTAEGVGAGLILIYPFRSEYVTRPFARIPAGEIVRAFDILRFPFDPALTASLLGDNRRLFDEVVDVGGNQYPVGALELFQSDWTAHFGASYPALNSAKNRYDPNNVMTPGQGIFTL